MKRKDIDRLKRTTIDSLVVYDNQKAANAIKAYVVLLGFLINREIERLKPYIKYRYHVPFQYNGKMLDFCIDEDLLYENSTAFTASHFDHKRDIIISFRIFADNYNRFEIRVYDLSTMRLGFFATVLIKNENKRR